MSTLSVPLKTVLMYHADNTGESIPTGYEVCDGRLLGIGTHDIGGGSSTYQLPDLRNRFILGSDPTLGSGLAGDGSVNGAGGAPGPKGTGGVNQVTLAISEMPAHNHGGATGPSGQHFDSGPGGTGYPFGSGVSDQTTQDHTHPISSQGGGSAHENRPRYYGLVFIMKTKL